MSCLIYCVLLEYIFKNNLTEYFTGNIYYTSGRISNVRKLNKNESKQTKKIKQNTI